MPERATGATVDTGFDLGQSRDTLKKAISTLREAEIPVSIFADADIDQVRAAHRMGSLRGSRYPSRDVGTE